MTILQDDEGLYRVMWCGHELGVFTDREDAVAFIRGEEQRDPEPGS